MMNPRVSLIIGALLIAALYQNCGGQQTFDETTPGSNAKQNCTVQNKSINVLANSNGSVTLQLSELLVRQTEWYVDGRFVRAENSRNFSYTFPVSGTYRVRVDGLTDECLTPAFTAERLIEVSVGGGGPACNPLNPVLSASPSSANINSNISVSLSNAASFVNSSIRWTVNNVARPDRDGFATIDVSSPTPGPIDVVVSANQTCNRQETASLRLTIGAPSGAAALSSFSVQQQISVLRDSGMNAVYSVQRQPAINLIINAANLSSASVVGVSDDCNGANCYTLQPAQTSATACYQTIRRLALVGTNSQTVNEDFFIFCPATTGPLASATCTVGRTSRRAANEFCPGSETISANPNPCTLSTADGVCTSTLQAANLALNRIHRLYLVETSGALGTEVACLPTQTTADTVLPWINFAGFNFRLMKGPVGASCSTPISEFTQVTADLFIRGVVGTVTTTTSTSTTSTTTSSTTSTTQPRRCPAQPLGGCNFSESPPGFYTESCMYLGRVSSCDATCSADGEWNLTKTCGGQTL